MDSIRVPSNVPTEEITFRNFICCVLWHNMNPQNDGNSCKFHLNLGLKNATNDGREDRLQFCNMLWHNAGQFTRANNKYAYDLCNLGFWSQFEHKLQDEFRIKYIGMQIFTLKFTNKVYHHWYSNSKNFLFCFKGISYFFNQQIKQLFPNQQNGY